MRARSLLHFATFLIGSVPANRSVAQSRPQAESRPTLELRGRVLDAEGAPIKEAGIAVGPANRTLYLCARDRVRSTASFAPANTSSGPVTSSDRQPSNPSTTTERVTP